MSSNSRNSIQSGHSCGSSSEFGFKTDIFVLYDKSELISVDFLFSVHSLQDVILVRNRFRFSIFFVRFLDKCYFRATEITYVRSSRCSAQATQRQRLSLLYSVFQLMKTGRKSNPIWHKYVIFSRIFLTIPQNSSIIFFSEINWDFVRFISSVISMSFDFLSFVVKCKT